MADRLKAILNRIIEWWKKFTRGQKTLIGSITGVVIVALVILLVVVSQPDYNLLIECEDYNEASQVMELLDDNSIEYKFEDATLMIYVVDDALTDAHVLLGTNDIQSYGYSIDDVFDGSFSTTEADKEKKYQLYLEETLAEELVETQTFIDGARVELSIPDNDGTILSQQKETYVSAILTLNTEITEDNAAAIAQFLSTAVGNDDTNNILLMDANSNVLFSGGDTNSVTGTASAQLTLRVKAESNVKNQVTDVLLGSGLYDNVKIGLNLSMDFDEEIIDSTEYSVPDGMSQGYYSESSTYNEETRGGAAAVPGTDSNDENGTTYVIEDNENTYSIIEETNYSYLVNNKQTQLVKAVGTVNPEESSMSVVATQYAIYDQDTMENDGSLGDLTFDEFVAANNDMVQLEVADEYYTMLSNATGIPESDISILAYEIPFFQYSDDSGFDLRDYLQFILAAAILLLLGFVVFRSTRSSKEEAEIEPELSVESLLESTKTEELEDIGYNEKSETRLLIEKFVDENPEAVANLLRNWLNDDEWG